MSSPSANQRMQAEQARAYRGAVEVVEQRLGTALPRFRAVEFRVAGYKKPEGLGQAPYYRFYPGLSAKPYWERDAWPTECRAILARFEGEQQALRDEFEAALPATVGDFRGQRTGYFGVADRWLSYALVRESGEPVPQAFATFPKLARILQALVDLRVPCKTYFALMKPGVHLAEHCGGQNIALRMHLALRIPPGDTCLRVGGIGYQWENGKTVFFDDTFVHEAWNRTPQDRYILLMRMLHPELSALEREAYFLIEEEFRTSDLYLSLKAEIEAENAAEAARAKAAPASAPPPVLLGATAVSPTSPWVLDPQVGASPFLARGASPSLPVPLRDRPTAGRGGGGLPKPRLTSTGGDQLHGGPTPRWRTVSPLLDTQAYYPRSTASQAAESPEQAYV
jgi:hypothetical protein